MKVLPPRTEPPTTPVGRRHQPPPAGGGRGYRAFVPCLRWDFGFTCAFCLLHEADVTAGMGVSNVSGGAMSVEHRVLRRDRPDLANDYGNCYYACENCNKARATRPITTAEGTLLDPIRDCWADHFRWQDLRLVALDAGDRDAGYTLSAYRLNSPYKLERRRSRWRLLVDYRRALHNNPRLIQRLRALWRATRRAELIEAIGQLRLQLRRASEVLERFSCVPADAPGACRCGRRDHHSLPPVLGSQCHELPRVGG